MVNWTWLIGYTRPHYRWDYIRNGLFRYRNTPDFCNIRENQTKLVQQKLFLWGITNNGMRRRIPSAFRQAASITRTILSSILAGFHLLCNVVWGHGDFLLTLISLGGGRPENMRMLGETEWVYGPAAPQVPRQYWRTSTFRVLSLRIPESRG